MEIPMNAGKEVNKMGERGRRRKEREKKERSPFCVLPVYDFAGNAFPGLPVLLSFIPVPIDVLFHPLSLGGLYLLHRYDRE